MPPTPSRTIVKKPIDSLFPLFPKESLANRLQAVLPGVSPLRMVTGKLMVMEVWSLVRLKLLTYLEFGCAPSFRKRAVCLLGSVVS